MCAMTLNKIDETPMVSFITELKLQRHFSHHIFSRYILKYIYFVYTRIIYLTLYFWMLIGKKVICSSTSGLIVILLPRNGSIHVDLKMYVGFCSI